MTNQEILARLPALQVLVLGDICLDRWCRYDPDAALPSAETGIPRIGVTSVEVTPGAGGTIANNLAALGVKHVAVLGTIGQDGFGWELKRALDQRGIDSSLLVEVPDLLTFTYTKVINAATDVEDCPRLDFIVKRPLSPDVEQTLIERFYAVAKDVDIVIVSDQAETSAGGVVTPAVRAAVQEFAASHPDTIVWVDSRARAELYRGVILKPNQQEASEACMRAFGRLDHAALREQTRAPLLLVTHGGRGVKLLDAAGEQWVETPLVANPIDICGAGDSFTAGASCALAVTGDPVLAARFGNQVASITIMKRGTGTASPEELLSHAHAGH